MPAIPIAVTCGEPAGIGPEIAAKARAKLGGELPFFWLGDPRHLPRATPWQEIATPRDAVHVPAERLPVLVHRFAADVRPGLPQPANAACVISVIARAVGLVGTGEAAAIVTAPIHKKALKDGADFAFPGHTEYLAHLGGAGRAVMMLASEAINPPLRVVPATIHIALKDVPGALGEALLEETIRITHSSLIDRFAIPAPRLAIAGLNPHAGEGGQMGDEELRMIAPLLARLRSDGIAVSGPYPADTMFHAGARARYDAAIAMYHDQALIPIKTLDFSGGVNVTLGLPFVRTSPDHGTAFDIAGKGIADPASLIAALRMASDLAARTRRAGQG
ncbi:MAG: 4-hydroxythreonine-4-phosphate dehydrogenase PdxA [Rhodobacteraceae bacterium]|nr:4-hydroxythreonine-4-phosphate dehydrogenase PdxA [Paracoccaceae bacterium]MCP5340831.1 4-hydroxythreonine-4-phosphate dehydrogenase PdxA [Paracoccaceae bacterium]